MGARVVMIELFDYIYIRVNVSNDLFTTLVAGNGVGMLSTGHEPWEGRLCTTVIHKFIDLLKKI